MAISGTEDISLVRKEVKESQAGSIQTTKTLIFKHEANAGDLVIDTTLLTPPAEALANGFIQDNPSSVNLLVNKKNLKIHSSRGVWLQMHEDFKVTGANTIQLIGNIEALGGALEGEVFTIYAAPIQSNAVLTTDHKKQYQEYILLDGQTVLNLGREYEVNRNPLAQIGSIRVFRNGVGPQLRNVGNAAASPLADGNYHEIDVGNGLGTTIEFNIPPSGQDDVIVVEFGLEYAGDFSLVGDMQSMWGSILKLAEDVKDLGPYDITRYINANPSEIERRGFGDILLGLLDLPVPYETEWQDLPSVAAGVWVNSTGAGLTYGTVVTNIGKWKRRGGDALIKWDFRQTAGGSNGAAGLIVLNLDPLIGTIDVARAKANSDLSIANTYAIDSGLGDMYFATSQGPFQHYARAAALNTTQIKFSMMYTGVSQGGSLLNAGNTMFQSTNLGVTATLKIPIQGWSSTRTLREYLVEKGIL